MAARTILVCLAGFQLLHAACARIPAASNIWDSVQVIHDRTILEAPVYVEEDDIAPAPVAEDDIDPAPLEEDDISTTKFHIPDLPDSPQVTAKHLEDKYDVCLDTPTQRFGLLDPEEENKPDAVWVHKNGKCRLEEYCGGLTGDWSVDASDKNNIGIAEAALQMLSLNDDDEGKAKASEFLRDLRNLADLDIITQDDGGITRKKNIKKASAACAHLINVTTCQS